MTEQLDIFDDIEAAAKNAEQFAVRSYFGKCTVTVNKYTQWVEKSPIEITREVYNKLANNEKSMELQFSVDIEELKPDIGFQYERKVSVGGPDWNKIVIPSLKKVYGKDSGEMLKKISGAYVHVKDVPQIKSPEFSTIKFEQVFDNLDQCKAAADALFSGGGDTVATPATTTPLVPAPVSATLPEGYTQDVWNALVEGEIKPALQSGQTVVELATTYGAPVPMIATIKASLG